MNQYHDGHHELHESSHPSLRHPEHEELPQQWPRTDELDQGYSAST